MRKNSILFINFLLILMISLSFNVIRTDGFLLGNQFEVKLSANAYHYDKTGELSPTDKNNTVFSINPNTNDNYFTYDNPSSDNILSNEIKTQNNFATENNSYDSSNITTISSKYINSAVNYTSLDNTSTKYLLNFTFDNIINRILNQLPNQSAPGVPLPKKIYNMTLMMSGSSDVFKNFQASAIVYSYNNGTTNTVTSIKATNYFKNPGKFNGFLIKMPANTSKIGIKILLFMNQINKGLFGINGFQFDSLLILPIFVLLLKKKKK